MTRVAALQIASGTDVAANLATCLRMIDAGARRGAQVMVLPEFSNHISWYDDAEHAWEVAVDLDGEFLTAVADRARLHSAHVVINVSLRRAAGAITVTSLMYGPDGELLAQADKQTLMGHENTWFERAEEVSPVVETAHGRLAMFPCRDGVTFETPRCLALRGAELFCDSLNSFALDEESLHVPARAPENRVFLVAANKVGPLIPEHLLEPVSEETHIPLEFLYGAGGSQIVSPEGVVLARAPKGEEAVIVADVDLTLARDKRRSDGTDIFASRRPAQYGAIAEPPVPLDGPAPAESVTVSVLSLPGEGGEALKALPEVVKQLPSDCQLAVLPELCFGSDQDIADPVIEAISAACRDRPGLLIATTLCLPVLEGCAVAAMLVGAEGVVARQFQLHATESFPQLYPGSELHLVDLPWGRIALLTADDARYPEVAKLAAIGGAHALVVPGKLREPWEATLGLSSRAAENRLCLVYSSVPLEGRAGMIADLETDFTIMTPWKERKFDGLINQPLITMQALDKPVTSARIRPVAACNKLMSERTDLIQDRPWRLSAGLVGEPS